MMIAKPQLPTQRGPIEHREQRLREQRGDAVVDGPLELAADALSCSCSFGPTNSLTSCSSGIAA